MARNAVGAHARDELGLVSIGGGSNPVLAAVASGMAFSLGAVLPTIVAIGAPQGSILLLVFASTLIFLLGLGALGAWLGGARPLRPALRVGFWGVLAMLVTAVVGALVGRAV